MFKEQVHKLTYDEVKIAIRDTRLYNQVHLPIVGEGVDARELPKLPLLMKPFTAVPLVIPADDSPPFKASINAVNSCLKKNKVRGDLYPAVLPFHGNSGWEFKKFLFIEWYIPITQTQPKPLRIWLFSL